MRLLTTLTILLTAAPLFADDILTRRIEVRFSNTPLKLALEQIATRAHFEWSYNANIIDGQQKVSLQASDWTVREVLYALLGDQYQFKSNGNYLIIKKAPKSPELSGYLKDPATGRGIEGAVVYDKNTLRSTTTDKSGFYQIKVKGEAEIIVSKINYLDTVILVSANTPRFRKIDMRLDTLAYTPPRNTLRKELVQAGKMVDAFFHAGLEGWNNWNITDSFHRQSQVSILPGVGTNRRLSSEVSNNYSLNLIAGSSRMVGVLEIGGVANFTREKVRGLQVAGVFNLLRGDNHGMQIAGAFNSTGGMLKGAQIAGVLNHADTSGGMGLQVGGLMNVARSIPSGFQVAGAVNTVQDMEGAQIAGVYNRCKKMKGIQIGLVNKAETLEGIQIGLLNIAGAKRRVLFNWRFRNQAQ